MRTTVTLDPDVAAALEQAARERRTSFKKVLNDAVRAGLRPAVAPRPYRLPTRPMGLRPGIDLDKASAIAGDLDDREVMRKLELRK
ncbi:MAG: ribbon-helix-helix domain-containing protein [Actinomycetota bacterium]|nr:ribbon-helix-helix domain-containing protein [Actinomycetota bacterium]